MVVRKLIVAFVIGCLLSLPAAAEQYLSQDDFLKAVFKDGYQRKTLWLNDHIKTSAKAILKHDYNALRIRYWFGAGKTAWILDEIGKEKPITIGVVVADNKVTAVKILAFRESRGWEVRHDFFTDQFHGVNLQSDNRLNRSIDGISGATLSVRAVKKVVALALFLNGEVSSTTAQAALN